MLEEGAQRAQEAGEIGRAATLLLAALTLARHRDQLGPRRADLERQAILALSAAHRWSELDPLIRDAWSRSYALRPEERIALAIEFSNYLFWTGAVAEAWSLIEAELAKPGPAQASGYAAALARCGSLIAWYRGDHEQALRYAERGLAAARSAGDAAAEWDSRHDLVHIRYAINGNRQAAADAFSECAASARALGSKVGEAVALFDVASHHGGDALTHVESGIRAAEQAGSPVLLAEFQVLRGGILLLHGRPDEAESLFVRFGPELRFGQPLYAPWMDISEAMLHLHRGDLEAARRLLCGPAAATEAAQLEYHAVGWSAALGWVAWEENRWADAVMHLEPSARRWRSGRVHILAGGPVFVPLHVDALLRLGKPADATALLEQVPGGRQLSPFYDAALAAARFRLVGADGLQQEEATPRNVRK